MNCCFSPDISLQTIGLMKEALVKEGLKPYLMIQPICYYTPDSNGDAFLYLPETPFGELVFSIHVQYCRTHAHGPDETIKKAACISLSPQGILRVNLWFIRSFHSFQVYIVNNVKQVISHLVKNICQYISVVESVEFSF